MLTHLHNHHFLSLLFIYLLNNLFIPLLEKKGGNIGHIEKKKVLWGLLGFNSSGPPFFGFLFAISCGLGD
ncbi:hypothetical protein F4809DRAFT_508931 [Biscogniauxia mediterranea]|nr:hypothetical protein F4809DRAFT_508931 [Biscogniauxia mediterranea]